MRAYIEPSSDPKPIDLRRMLNAFRLSALVFVAAGRQEGSVVEGNIVL